ncbi:Transcription factor [Sesamum angolense]|uniref:Transcription factor n=1 Tax=Sesamum angolense TaxID=2727404 RepID=A0AAE1WW79_9LAMI|nr:Transcription factor [Sesamum angolense]
MILQELGNNNSDGWSCSIPIILNFGTAPENPEDVSVEEAVVSQGSEPARRTRPSRNYDHIVAERRRAELISKRSALLSGLLTKERVKTLEEQAAKQTIESVVLVKKSHITEDDETSGSSGDCSEELQPLPEIEAKICDNQIVLKIQCAKFKGVVPRLLAQVDNLNLTILNAVVTTFGNNHAYGITVIAEKEKELSLSLKEIVRALRSAILRDG